MKKIISIIITVALLGTVCVYAYLKLNEVKVGSLESITPATAMYYFSSSNLGQKIAGLKDTAFYKQIEASLIFKKIKDNPATKKIRNQLPVLAEFFKKDTSFALFSLGAPSQPGRAGSLSSEPGDILFLTRIDLRKLPGINKSLREFYMGDKAGKKEDKEDKVKTASMLHKGIRITTFTSPKSNNEASLAVVGDVIAISNNSSIIRKCIDLARKQNSESLQASDNFQRLTAKVRKDSIGWGYGDLKRYYQENLRVYSYDVMKGQGAESDIFLKMKPLIDMMNVSKDFIFDITRDPGKNGLIFKSYNTFDSTKDEAGLLKILVPNKELDKAGFNLVPSEAIGYLGGNNDLAGIWKFWLRMMIASDEVTKARLLRDPRYSAYKDQINSMGMANTLAQMEFALGISIENDIIPCLGENYGVVFAKFDDIDVPVNPETTASGAAPAEKKSVPIIFPQLYAFCELKNSAKLQEVLIGATQRFVDQANKDRQELEAKIRAAQAANAKDKQPLPEPAKDDKKYMELKSRDYRGAKVYTVEVPDFPVGQLRFNYAFVDKYIIVSFSPEATEKAIDVISGKSDNLSGSVGFAAAKNKIPQSYSDLGFFDFRRLLNNIRSTKFFKELREKLPDKGAQAFSQADLDSVLDLLSNINSLTMTRRKADAETVESICYFDVKGL